MNNVLFNVNGNKEKDLLNAIKLIFSTNGYDEKNQLIKGYIYSDTKGLILLKWLSGEENEFRLPVPLPPHDILPFVISYLKSEKANQVPRNQYENNLNYNGVCVEGWRVYVENSGHVYKNDENLQYYDGALCAIKKVYLWQGK